MNDTALEAILRRDRIIVAAALVVIAILAWAYLAYLGVQMDMPAAPLPSDATGEMPGMDMPGMDMSMPGKDMGTAMAPGFGAWTPANFAFVFAMWAVMMVGMMTPSVTPMVLLYALVGRKARTDGKPFAPTGWFFAGYLLVWIFFSVAGDYMPMDFGQRLVADTNDDRGEFNRRRPRSYRGWPLSVDPA